MTLFEKINSDIKEAMKAKEKDRLDALRAIKAQFLLIKTSAGGKDEISDEEGLKVIQKMIKQRKDSAEIYKTQNRPDLYEKEVSEINYLEPYMPAQMTDEELTTAVSEIITKVGAETMKDMGKVMGTASKELAGKADGKAIADKVKKLLG